MTDWYEWLHHPLILKWGWVLAHFVWQGTLLALFAGVLTACTARCSARLRYQLLTVTFFSAMLLPLGTWLRLDLDSAAYRLQQNANSAASLESDPRNHTAKIPHNAAKIPRADAPQLSPVNQQPDKAVSPIVPVSNNDTFAWKQHLEAWLPIAVVGWFLGVLLISVRLLGGWVLTRRLMAQSFPLRDDWIKRLQPFVSRLNVSSSIRWLESTKIQVPQVIGWLKPAVLVPSSLFTTMAPDQLESLLLHELIHIRRHDYIINLAQCVIETVFFFHPGVLWVSRKIRLEREFACDAAVVELTGDNISFSRALLSLADQTQLSQPALAATGSHLTQRIQALLGMKRTGSTQSIAVLLCLAVVLIVCGLFSMSTPSGTQPESRSDAISIERFLDEGLPVPDLSGQVVDARGNPVPKATVLLRQSARAAHGSGGPPVEWLDLAKTTTDPQGKFAFTGILDEKNGRINPAYGLVVFQSGYAIGWKHVRPQKAIDDLRIKLAPPVPLTGKIVDTDGNAIPRAKVRLKYLMSIRHITQADLEIGRWPSWSDAEFLSLNGAQKFPETTTDENGAFELPGLVADRGAILEISHPEFKLKTSYTATVDKLDAATAERSKREVQTGKISIPLERGYRIRIKVLDAATGKIIPNIRYARTHESWRYPPRHVAETGIIDINQLDSPQFRIIVYPPEGDNYLAYQHFVEWPESERDHELEVRLQRGIPVRGRVVSQETGNGIAEVNIHALGPKLSSREQPQHYAPSPVTTDEQGRFAIPCPPGDFTFQPRGRIAGFVTPPNSDSGSKIITVTDAGPKENPIIALRPAPRFRLVVSDPEGEPVEGASVRTKAHLSLNSYFPIEGQTDEDGKYLLDQLYLTQSAVQELMEEEVIIRNRENTLGARLLIKRPDDDAPLEQRLEIKLQPLGAVAGRTVDLQGQPVAGTSIYLYKRNHQQNGSSATGDSTTTDREGRFTLRGVLPGVEHSLSLRHTRYKVPNSIHLRFQIEADESHDFGEITIASLTKPENSDLPQVTAPSISGLSPQEAFDKLQASYQQDYQTYRDEFDKLKNEHSAMETFDIVSRREPTPVYCAAFWKLVQTVPESDVALKSCLWIVNARRVLGSEKQSQEYRQQATRHLQKHFLGRPEMAEYVPVGIDAFVKPEDRHRSPVPLEHRVSAAEEFMESNQHPEVQARTTFYIAERLMDEVKWIGPSGNTPNPERIELCRKYYTRIKNEFPDHKHFLYGTYGEAAERMLFDLDHMLVGKTPPDFTATDLNDRRVSLSDYRGQLVIVDFWQGGFGPATDDHHGLKHILDKARDRVAVLGILSSSREEALQDVKEHDIEYSILADGDDGPIFTDWNIHTWPTTFLLDENGVILYRGQRGTSLENVLLEELAEL